MKPETETKIIRVLQAGIVVMLLGIALNLPHPNGRGGVRDQFVEGWREAKANSADQPPIEDPGPSVPGVAQSGEGR